MFITAGLLNMLLKHFRTTHAELSEVLVELKYDYAILQNPTAKIDADILGLPVFLTIYSSIVCHSF